MAKRTLKEAVAISKHKLNLGKPFGFNKKLGSFDRIGYVITMDDGKTYYVINNKIGKEVQVADYL